MNPDPELRETKAALRLDDAVKTACDLIEPEDWTRIVRALHGRAPSKRDSICKALRLVRDRAKSAGRDWAAWQERTLTREAAAIS